MRTDPRWLPPLPRLAAGGVRIAFSTRAEAFNLGDHVGDDPAWVAANRRRAEAMAGRPIQWLRQVHGAVVHRSGGTPVTAPTADAQVAAEGTLALAILVADCLPVLLSDEHGQVIAAAHAGWRGLAAGVLEATVAAMRSERPQAHLQAWFGPCIGRDRFEVGDEVRSAFVDHNRQAEQAFRPGLQRGKWWADLPALARQRLVACGAVDVPSEEPPCTVSLADQFWSYRREGQCGRMAALIWRDPAPTRTDR